MPTTRKSVLLGTDGSCAVQVDALAESLNRVCKHLRFAGRTEPFDLGPFVVSNPAIYERLAAVPKPLNPWRRLVWGITGTPPR
jgi:hypothetical protein